MADPTQPGEIIAAKYRVERVLGRGGMGMVVSAVHLALDQRVAVKLLLDEIRREDPTAEKRFDREARSAAQLRSPHVCRVLDAGFLEGGTPFLAMEYLEGADLADELAERGRLDFEEAARWVRQACEGVSEAHSAGIVHRDLKPANLFLALRPDGGRILKVLDFGVSKSINPAGPAELSLTKTATLVGSPVYMSPEQLRSSRDVDARTDVWALGIILFELVAGKPPFDGETMVGLAHSILSDAHPTLEALGVPAPSGFQEVIDRALAKEPDQRFATAMELSQALASFAPDPIVTATGATSPVSAVPSSTTGGAGERPSADPAPTPNGHTNTSASQSPMPRWVWWAASLLLASALALGLWLRRETDAAGAQSEATPSSSPESHEATGSASPQVEPPTSAPPQPAVELPPPEAALDEAPAAGSAPPDEQSETSERPRAEGQRAEPEEAPPAARSPKRRRRRPARPEPPAEPARTEPTPTASQEKPDDGLPDFGGRR